MPDGFIVTCEHGGNGVPAAYRGLFRGRKDLLESHRGYDPGALDMARSLATALDAPLMASTTSRLLIDLNRPLNHPQVYSTVTRCASPGTRTEIAREYHQPYWTGLERAVDQAVGCGRRMVHISSHSFTPVLNGQVRRADVGLLYDPRRRAEADLCARWKAALSECEPALRVRRNYPYHGNAPGLTTHLRRGFSAEQYFGIELEVNQQIILGPRRRWTALRRALAESLLAACGR
jgi:predicted N-formylglutamate amidohydrolase